jgi:exodeoxyribonuclease VII large subunit
VIRDIVRVAHRRFPVAILLVPAPVQGEGAALGLAAALRQVSSVADVDLVILARGGGSMEDLWAFNEEPLARAIAACRVPVISAVGHETDFTIADFVADLRAPTPSAAAELAVPVAAALVTQLHLLGRRLGRGVETEFRASRLALERARTRIGDPRRLVEQRRQAVDDLSTRGGRALVASLARNRAALHAIERRLFRAHPQRRVADQRTAMAGLERRLGDAVATLMGRRRRALEGLVGKVETLSPLRVLERGYSLVRTRQGHLVDGVAAVAAGDEVTVILRDGEVDAAVQATRGRQGRHGKAGRDDEK